MSAQGTPGTNKVWGKGGQRQARHGTQSPVWVSLGVSFTRELNGNGTCLDLGTVQGKAQNGLWG